MSLKRPIRILHVFRKNPFQSKGGVETFIRVLCEGLSKNNIESDIFCLGPIKEYSNPINKVNCYQERRDFSILSAEFSFAAGKSFKELSSTCDALHLHYPDPFADLLYLSLKDKPPTVVTYHADIVNKWPFNILYAPVRLIYLTNVDMIVSTSPAYVSSSKILRKYLHKTKVIPIGLNEINPNYPNNLVEKKKEPQYFLYLGVLRKYKNVKALIKALEGSNLTLLIAGDGSEYNNLRELTLELKLNNIHFYRQVSEQFKFSLLSNCLALVLPSNTRAEAFGIVLLEAARLKKPLITFENNTGTSYINKDGVTGLVVDKDDKRQLTEALDFMHNNPHKAREMGEQAYLRFKRKFTTDHMIYKYIQCYNEITDKKIVSST